MANPEHLQMLRRGSEVWNQWRRRDENRNRDFRPDLSGASLACFNFNQVYLAEVDFIGANLVNANFSHTVIAGANFSGADLSEAFLLRTYGPRVNFSRATLAGADLTMADLEGADLTMAMLTKGDLSGAILLSANLSEADLSEMILGETFFSNTNLTNVRGIETCVHRTPSTLDHRTLAKSGPLPLVFLRGCGLPDTLIDYLPSLLSEPIQYDSLFISHASRDRPFAERLHADLQNKGVRCWYAPEDMKIGDEYRSRIDAAIHVHDRLLLILSEHSLKSRWVQKEVETAFEKEEKENRFVLFPIQLDDAIRQIDVGWAADIRRQRHIGDFTQWKEYDVYQKALARLLQDLKTAEREPRV